MDGLNKSIFCGIGERCREGEELYRDMKDAGVLPNMVMVFGQMNEPPGSRFRVGHTTLTMAEYFRDDEHRDVLLQLLAQPVPLQPMPEIQWIDCVNYRKIIGFFRGPLGKLRVFAHEYLSELQILYLFCLP